MINESNLADLIFSHVNDSLVWCRLQQVSKRFYEASKRKLLKKEHVKSFRSKLIWHELPNGIHHGLVQEYVPIGILWFTGNRFNGHYHGQIKYFWNDGDISVITYSYGNKIQECIVLPEWKKLRNLKK